jgi:hypothetical protein
MTRAAWVGLAAIAFMFAEPWLRRFLDARPRVARNDSRRLDSSTPEQQPIRGTLLRPGRELERGDR